MVFVIGVDPHKLSHTAAVVDPATNTDLGSLRIPSSWDGYQRLQQWAQAWPDRVWAIENARGLGHHLAQWLVRSGEQVLDVPPTATARVRELSRGGRRKTDRIDAAAAACVAFTHGDQRPIELEDESTEIALLDQRRTDVTRQASRVRNQLHALLRELLPGGVDVAMTVENMRILVRRHQPATPADKVRRELALEIIGDLQRLRCQLDLLGERIADALERHQTTVTDVFGVGPVLAAGIIARTGTITRFPTEAAFAAYAGVAPIDVSSGEHNRHRLSRTGDRQLNSLIHRIAICQVSHHNSPGQAYYQRKRGEGKTPREAVRCLKRQITKHLWRHLTTDQQQRAQNQPAHPEPVRAGCARPHTPPISVPG